MDTESRAKAARAYRILTKGRDATQIAEIAGIPDAATVRSFLDGMSWPRLPTRSKLEDAAGMERGDLALYARGDKVIREADEDPVVAAIDDSRLSRANKARLKGTYYDMLDAQGSRSDVG